MFKLLKESLVAPFILRPCKMAAYFILALFGIKSFNDCFAHIETENHHARVKFLKTIYFNLRSLRFGQAIRFPVFIYKKTEIICAKGAVVIDAPHITSGMIRWGRFDTYRSQGTTRIINHGTIIFKGGGRILRGNDICVFSGGVLEIGDDFFLGENTMIYCQCDIKIGQSICLTYHSQIFDTDFHYSMNVATGEVARKVKPIVIGDYNWIGNKTTIKKGTKTPAHMTVAASYAVLNKDYTKDVPEYSIIGGVPAKLLSTGHGRIFNNELSRIAIIDKWFAEHPTEKYFVYDLSDTEPTSLTEW